MQAAIVVVGDEILAGHTQDTNTRWIAKRLQALGLPLVEVRVVADEARAIQAAVWESQERREADIVITCGGLGPTHDDRTVAALAALHAAPLVRDEATWQRLLERYAKRPQTGGEHAARMTAGSKMATVPRGAEVFANEAGAAPALVLRRSLSTRTGDAYTVVLPGVPQELQTLWATHIGRRIEGLCKGRTRPRAVREALFRGYESDVAALLMAIEADHPGIAVGSYPHWGKKEVVLRVSGLDADAVVAAFADLEARMTAAGHLLEVVPPAPDASPNP